MHALYLMYFKLTSIKSLDEKLQQFTGPEGSLPAAFWKLRKRILCQMLAFVGLPCGYNNLRSRQGLWLPKAHGTDR